MYAVVETGGKQYKVEPGQKLEVEKLPGEKGTQVELGRVLAVSENGALKTGSDVAGAKVTATIQDHGRGDKVIVFKFKRKKQYKRTIGHRQHHTVVKVDSIALA
jgi:large subunit ribosomal protein L21